MTEKEASMMDKMTDIIKRKDTCVLATTSGQEPHCSLMAYVTNEDAHEIYMICLRGSKKYKNMIHNPSVSLLIDTREDDTGRKREDIQALTVTGHFQAIGDETKRRRVFEKLLSKHPHLSGFSGSDDLEVFQVNVKSLQLLEGVLNSSFEAFD
jgi:nitroimidazol reductase NimA-like FMN-containing flavoprotein (pyridoxamine 5'-phosphate oxidase superfamily)